MASARPSQGSAPPPPRRGGQRGDGAVECRPAPAQPGDLAYFAEVMRTLGDETRLRILRALHGQSLCVGDLAEAVGVSQPLVSHHLKALKHAGLVSCRKEGPWVYYDIRGETFRRLGLNALWEPGGALAAAGSTSPPAP